MKILTLSFITLLTQQVYAADIKEAILANRGYVEASIEASNIKATITHSIKGRLVNCTLDFQVNMLIEDNNESYEFSDNFTIKAKGLVNGRKSKIYFANNLNKKYQKEVVGPESIELVGKQCSLLKKNFYEWCIDYMTPNQLSSDAENTFSDILEIFNSYKKFELGTTKAMHCKSAAKLHKESLKEICKENRGHWYCSDSQFTNKSKNSYAIFPYFWNSIHSSNLDVVKKLASLDIDMSQTDGTEKRTALFHAVFNWNDKLAELLLELGVNINHLNSYGQNVLFEASEAGHLDMVKTLISYGADEDTIDIYGHKYYYYNYFLSKEHNNQ